MGDTIEHDIFKEPRTPETEKKRRKISSRTALAILVLAVTATTGIVYAFTLASQTFPAYNPSSPLNGVCSVLTITTVSGGLARADCSFPRAAFNVTTSGSFSPTFTLPSGYSSLGVSTVSQCTNPTILTTAVAVTLAVGNYDYCLTYASN